MNKILITWVGLTDLNAAIDPDKFGLGPIGMAVTERSYTDIVLICDLPVESLMNYTQWLQTKTNIGVIVYTPTLSSPTDFGEIYQAASEAVERTLNRHKSAELTFHLSPGTPAMAAVWIILSKTRFPAELIESSKEHGVRTASIPFEMSAEFIPDLLRGPDKRLESLSASPPPPAPEFSDIIHRCRAMTRVIHKARRVAVRSVPVLIEGESGTGKELLARAVHKAGPRQDKPFVAVNCGAIPHELMESALFGHEKGSFTGADKVHIGYFESADKGTLFLDEVGELPLSAQVKLLRSLQESEIIRVGATKPIKIDVRIIAATNRNLIEETQANRFRVDLFYRLAVAVLHLPALANRKGDMTPLIDYLLEKVNAECKDDPGYRDKKISFGARNLLIQHDWPGNVRELLNTIRRAALWSEEDVIRSEDIREALIPLSFSEKSSVLNKPLGEGLSLPDIIKDVARHYLERAIDEAAGNKTKAAELVGLASYQTFSNWMKKYGLNE